MKQKTIITEAKATNTSGLCQLHDEAVSYALKNLGLRPNNPQPSVIPLPCAFDALGNIKALVTAIIYDT